MAREYKKAEEKEGKEALRENPINITEIWFKIVEKRYIYAMVVALALIAAFVVNKYSTPKYEASTTMLIKTNNDMLNNLDISNGLFWNNSEKDFQNALHMLTSYSITKATLQSMNMYCSYYQKINFHNADIYKDSPFEVIPDLSSPQPIGVRINVKLLNEKQCLISYESKQRAPLYDYLNDKVLEQTANIQGKNVYLNYGQWYKKDGMHFKIMLKKDKWSPNFANINYSFMMNNYEYLAYAYNHVNIIKNDDGSSIIRLKFSHENPDIAKDFINTLCKVYIEKSFNEKNYLNVTTIDFVNQQIASIGDSLTKAESLKENFQASHNTLNLTNDGQYLYERTNELQRRRAEAYTQQQYYDYMENYINNAKLDEGVASPAVMGVNDPVLNKLVAELSDAIIAHKTALSKSTEKNPKTQELALKIQSIRKQISESLRNLQKVSNMSQKELRRQQSELQTAINMLPSTERNMVNIQRQFKFNDEIYSFLYRKRAEAEIAKNAALPDHRVIDASLSSIKIYPKTLKNYLIGFLVAILLPTIVIVIRYLLKDTLDSRDDLSRISNRPILGFIPIFPKDANPMVVFSNPKSYITESYRTLRTNIKYVLKEDPDKEQEGKVVLISSSMPSEGKTTTSINLASVFSISGSKVILVELDLRKPSLHKKLGLRNDIGISSYYVNRNSVSEICQRTEFDNFDVICVGQVPPNPSEIIDSNKIDNLLLELRKHYDYIILDTPPINLIADAQTIAKQADVSLIVARSGVTNLSILKTSIQEMEERSGVEINFIFNGIESAMQKYGYGKGSYAGYGKYGYGYGRYGGYGSRYNYSSRYDYYGYGYFTDATNGQQSETHKHKHKNSK